MLYNFIFLQAQGQSPYQMLIMFGLIILVFYFFMIRPQQKKAKEQKAFRDAIKKGDSVVTIGGLHGKVSSVESDDTIIIEVDKGIKLKFEKSAISLEASKKYQGSVASGKE
ncbi:MAG TPA: preprotein translocase subunit YajC [Cytophagaceae bacterium]